MKGNKNMVQYRVVSAEETIIVKARGLKHAISIAKENRDPSSKNYGVTFVQSVRDEKKISSLLTVDDNGKVITMTQFFTMHERAVISQVLLEEYNGN
jgi:hypothetical protein